MSDFFEEIATPEYNEAMRMIDESPSNVEKPTGRFMEDLVADVTASSEEQFERMGWKKENITPVQANIYLENYHRLTKEIQDIQTTLENYIQFHSSLAVEWQKREVSKRLLQLEYYKEMLHAFADKELEGSKQKSVSLIAGKIGYRKEAPKFEYDDEKLLKYLQDNRMEMYLRPQPPKANKAQLRKDGEVKHDGIFLGGKKIPGVTVYQKKDDVFYIK